MTLWEVLKCQISYSMVVLYSRDLYEIIGLFKFSHSIKQPCSNVCLEKGLEMHQKCVKNAVPLLKIEYFDLQQAFKMSFLTQISSA